MPRHVLRNLDQGGWIVWLTDYCLVSWLSLGAGELFIIDTLLLKQYYIPMNATANIKQLEDFLHNPAPAPAPQIPDMPPVVVTLVENMTNDSIPTAFPSLEIVDANDSTSVQKSILRSSLMKAILL